MYEQIKAKMKDVGSSFSKIKGCAEKFSQNIDSAKVHFCFTEKLKTISELKNSFSVGAVDSGFFSDSFIGFDFCFIKASGSVFQYEDNKLVKNEHIPKNPHTVFVTPDKYLQKDEFEKFVSITRLKQELLLARQIIESHNLDYFLLDGGLIPHPQDRVKKDSEIYSEYQDLIKHYLLLYDVAEKKNTLLIGCVEDSRSNFFTKKVDLENVNDLFMLNFCMKKKQALNFFRIEDKMLEDIVKFKPVELYGAYLKINDYDLPLKIEMIMPTESALDIIYFLSRHTKNYSYPSVIIDADLRAKLSFSEVNTLKNYIESLSNQQGIKKLRRNRRPF